MGQLVTRATGGIEKRDINPDYETYGNGDTYAIDGNDEYQSLEFEETYDRMSNGSPKVWMDLRDMMMPNSKLHAKELTRRCGCVSVVIFLLIVVVVGLVGGGIAIYFTHFAPRNSPSGSPSQNLTS